MRRFSAAICVLGLIAYLSAAGAFVAQSLVLCTEPDGQVAMERSALGMVCGPRLAPAAVAAARIAEAGGHCLDCEDLPLRLGAAESLRRLPAVSSPALLPAAIRPAASPLPYLHAPVAVLSAATSPPVAPRSTILRI